VGNVGQQVAKREYWSMVVHRLVFTVCVLLSDEVADLRDQAQVLVRVRLRQFPE
jgi:hypothetical protein